MKPPIQTMKEAKLREVAECAKCHRKIGHAHLPLFWRVRIERWGIKLDAVRRKTGLEMMLGSPTLANAMGPDEDMAIEVMDPVELTLCDECGSDTEVVIAMLAERSGS